MQQRISFLAVPALAVMFSMSAFGAVTTIVASGSGTGNGFAVGGANQTNTGLTNVVAPVNPVLFPQTTFNIAPNAGWVSTSSLNGVPLNLTGNAGWVSHITNQNLGAGANGQWVDFYQTFMIADATILSARLAILADDRADVFINGNTIATTGLNPGSACNAIQIGCLATTQGNFGGMNTSWFNGGNVLNTLRVRVYQDRGSGFGTAYLMNITSVPEPGFYGLLSLGLGGLALAVQRRRKNMVS